MHGISSGQDAPNTSQIPNQSSVVAYSKPRPKVDLEQDIQTAATGHRSHDTRADATTCTSGGVPAVIGIVSLLLRGVAALLLRWVIHRLALGVIPLLTLLWLAVALLGWVVALLLGLAAVVVASGALRLLVVWARVVGLGRVGGWWACLEEVSI